MRKIKITFIGGIQSCLDFQTDVEFVEFETALYSDNFFKESPFALSVNWNNVLFYQQVYE